MNILIIEDNSLKREKVTLLLDSIGDHTIMEAASYNSGLTAAMDNEFDLMIVDMSMPTFDRSEHTQGGRFRAIAGKEIVAKLFKLGKLKPFIILTGFRDFSVDTQSLSIEQIHDLLGTYGQDYLGCIFFESSNTSWQEELTATMEKFQC
ncbi:response regulator [Pseudomonas sp. USTB-Z]|uniref:response regulator n=1 Tax=Pseudomonas sp. USTB-Z TaxID=2794351 RepID=UPI001C83A8F5|nr:response regulator [Pseudomonas sp. USTB-Z]MBX6690031.1 response regulator [Pseudomonas sp. USTB-Z]